MTSINERRRPSRKVKVEVRENQIEIIHTPNLTSVNTEKMTSMGDNKRRHDKELRVKVRGKPK